jgi:hypothetical protein
LVVIWSIASGLASFTLPGVVVRSTLVAAPAWKSACVVSVMHALLAREKFCVVVPPSVTPTFVAVEVTYPGKLAEMDG